MERPRLEPVDRGFTIFFGRYLYSRRDPLRRPRLIANSSPVQSRCLYMVFSPLLGYGIQELLDRIPDNSHVLAVESSQELFLLCRDLIDKNLLKHKNLTWVRLSDEIALLSTLDKIGLWNFKRIQRVDLNSGHLTDKTVYSKLFQFAMNNLAAYWRNRHALGTFGRQWIRHLYANLGAIARSEIVLDWDQSPEKIIAVVGAGPSLDRMYNFLIRHKDKLDIWSTDTALSALRLRKIEPNRICVLETQSWNQLDFHDTQDSRLNVIADLSSYPPTLTHTKGKISPYSSQFAQLKFLDRIHDAGLISHSIPPLGSVGLAALHLAQLKTSMPIFLIGLDFAYVPGKSHARGTAVHQWQLSQISRENPSPGWQSSMNRPRLTAPSASGNPVATDAVLMAYAALLKDKYGGSDRIFVLGKGLDLGLEVIDEKTATDIILKSQGACKALNPMDKNIDKRAVKFLESELGRLNQVIEKWDDYAAGAGNADAVCKALKDLDQVYCDFPDHPPLPKNDDGFLVRAVKRCRSLQRYILRAALHYDAN